MRFARWLSCGLLLGGSGRYFLPNRSNRRNAFLLPPTMTTDADRSLPQGEEIFHDHVRHFVREPQAASRAPARPGFGPTPVSIRVDSSRAPAGTGNLPAM